MMPRPTTPTTPLLAMLLSFSFSKRATLWHPLPSAQAAFLSSSFQIAAQQQGRFHKHRPCRTDAGVLVSDDNGYGFRARGRKPAPRNDEERENTACALALPASAKWERRSRRA